MRLTQSSHTASRLKRILGCILLVKLHTQEGLTNNTKSMVTVYTMFMKLTVLW